MEIRTYPFFWFLSTTFVSNTTGPFFRFGLIGMVRIRGWLGGNSSDSRQDAQSTPNYWLPVTSPVPLFYRQERACPIILTNAQFSMPNSHRMGIEHWELSIGKIVCFLIRDRICEKLCLATWLACHVLGSFDEI